MPLLVTFCNQGPSPRLAVAVVDPATDAMQWLDVPEGFRRGGAGIAVVGDVIYVGCQAGGVVKYDRELRPVAFLPTEGASSLHSVLYRPAEHALYVVSTGNDSLYRYTLDDDATRVVRSELVFCADPAGPHGDHHHVNSVVEHDGEVLVSMFGTASGPNHLHRRRGSIVRVSDGTTIASDLYHPHTLCSRGEELLVIESQAHALRRLAGGDTEQTWPIPGGYPRGIAEGDGDRLWIGASARRKQSASLGTSNDTAGTEPIDFRCRLLELDLDTGPTGRDIDLTSLAAEVFDVAALPPGAPFTPSPDRGMGQRLEAMQESFLRVTHDVWLLRRELEGTADRRVRRVARGGWRRVKGAIRKRGGSAR